MGDIVCAVCGEPWDRYSVLYEMSKEERRRLLRGEGCPCCKGKKSEREFVDEFFETLLENIE